MLTIHVAGIQIVIGKYNIQRCMICGQAIILEDLSKIMVQVDGPNERPFQPTYFKTGSLVEVEEYNGRKSLINIGELGENFKVEELPKNICLDLLEE